MRRIYFGHHAPTAPEPDWFTAFCATQVERIDTTMAPALASALARAHVRRQARLADTLDAMTEECAIARHVQDYRTRLADSDGSS